MTFSEHLTEIVQSAVAQGYDPVEAIMDYMAEKDSPMPRIWATAKVKAILKKHPPYTCVPT